MYRNSAIDILKGIGIILVVIGHSGCPIIIREFIYSFHMPLFFIASGYFFNETCIENKMGYTYRKIKGIYFPYLKWSIIFLLLHNLFYYCGILNSSYGTPSGICPQLYSLKDILSHLLNIIFKMDGHDSFLLGVYWFMRSIFVACLLICFSTWIFDKIVRSKRISIAFASILFCLIGGIMTYYKIYVPFFPQGGYKEVMATFFIGCGFFLAQINGYMRKGIVALVSLVILIILVWLHPTSMSHAASFEDWIIIPFTGVGGFVFLYYVGSKISIRNGLITNSLKYVGTKTFYILTFHLLMFKPVSLLNAYIYNLDWRVIGCHPIVFPVRDNWFWIIYTTISICLSLFIVWSMEMIGEKEKG